MSVKTQEKVFLYSRDIQCDKHIFRGTENTKNGRNQRKIDEHLNHTAISGHIFEVLPTIGLDSKKFELHSLQ